MSIIFRATIPLSPSTNHYWVAAGGGRRRLSDEARDYKALVEFLLEDIAFKEIPHRAIISEQIALYFPPDKINRNDWTNYVKFSEDLMHRKMGRNDAFVRHIDLDKEEIPQAELDTYKAELDSLLREFETVRRVGLDSLGAMFRALERSKGKVEIVYTWNGKVAK